MSTPWTIDQLENGLRVVTATIPTTQAVSRNLFVGVGSRAESAPLNGITHFLEHMVFKGTERRPDAPMIAGAIEGAGGVLNAYTNKEYTCYWNIVPYDRFPVAIDVLADMVLNSKLEQAEIDRERTVVQQELHRNRDNPGTWAHRLMGRAVYGDQPCGWDVGGSVETVEAMQREDFIEHIGAWYAPSNMVLSIAGNVEHDTVMAAARKLFGGIDDHPVPTAPAYDPDIRGARVVTESREVDQCNLVLGMPGFGRSDPERFALRIMDDVLGAGLSSRLFREVRERRGLAYSVGSGYGYLDDVGSFTVSAGVSRDHIADTIEVCRAELDRLTREQVDADELRKAKDHAIGRFRLSLETAHSQAQRNGEWLLTRGFIEDIEDTARQMEAVTPDEVEAVSRRLFEGGELHASVVGPAIEADEIEAALSS
jgi:predicted Zn-dependent peptidase